MTCRKHDQKHGVWYWNSTEKSKAVKLSKAVSFPKPLATTCCVSNLCPTIFVPTTRYLYFRFHGHFIKMETEWQPFVWPQQTLQCVFYSIQTLWFVHFCWSCFSLQNQARTLKPFPTVPLISPQHVRVSSCSSPHPSVHCPLLSLHSVILICLFQNICVSFLRSDLGNSSVLCSIVSCSGGIWDF